MTSSKIIEVMAQTLWWRRFSQGVVASDGGSATFETWHELPPAYQQTFRDDVEASLSYALQSGMAVVPVEPNNTVVTAGCFALDGPAAREALMAAMLSGDRHAVGQTKMRLRWAAMVAAASPNIKAPDREGEQDG